MLTELLTRSLVERECFDANTAAIVERLASRLAAINRYRAVRKYCFGAVIDAACGCGYGSAMLAKVPDVTSVLGLDADEDAIDTARGEFGVKAKFDVMNFYLPGLVETFSEADVIVSVETLEHLEYPDMFLAAVRESGCKRFIATFPSFPTSDFNPWHLNDITLEEVSTMLGREPDVAIEMDDAVWLTVYTF